MKFTKASTGLTLFFLFIVIYICAKNFPIDIAHTETFYWIFSTATQALASFVALIFAGYTVVLSIMNNLEQKDSSLAELNHQLKIEYYLSLKSLIIMTIVTIICSLTSLLINNSTNNPFRKDLFFISFALIVITFILSCLFVLQIINPEKYKKFANIAIHKFYQQYEKNNTVSIADLAMLYSHLDGIIKNIFIKNKIEIEGLFNTGFWEISELIKILKNKKLINEIVYKDLITIIKYRNLAIHGKIEFISDDIYKRLNQILNELNTK